MGRVILCTGKQAAQPYVFRSVDRAASSMEELCHILYHNAFVMQEELFDPELLRFIGEELGLSERADCLRHLCESHAGAKDIIVAIFCSTDYFDQEEIKEFLRRYDAFIEMSPAQRKKWNADRLLSEGREAEAEKIYREILEEEELAVFPEQEHGNLLHNLAVLEMHGGAFRQAPGHFREAYRLNRSDESLKQYLMSLKLTGQEELLEKELKTLLPRREVIEQTTQALYLARTAAELAPDWQELEKLKELHEQGKVAEYYEKADELLEKLKDDYREKARLRADRRV
ncbi:MAG: hypothetical protein K2N94_17130 [Lachnospiraceae bacterium]|nr:hypothetical protein [Lachnospiraceae bacterium]